MKQLLIFGCIVLVLADAASSAWRRISYREISPSKSPGITVFAENDGNTSTVVWEATWRFSPDQANIVVWNEIAEDAGWLQTRRWKKSEEVYMFTTDPVKRVVCSCTPQRSIVDQRKQPTTSLVSRKTVASYSKPVADGLKATKPGPAGVLQGPEHKNCTSVEVTEMVATLTKSGSVNRELADELRKLADQ
ncbi:MAG: hypothetical protein JNK74_19360 [Candidatus Hydrogenedentes bacterium]|nr:hypothetical protein [Candidatus Hydrogenedentota bacterium]